MAGFPSIALLMSLISDICSALPDSPNLLAVSTVWLVVIDLFYSLALTKNERFHCFGLGVA